MPPIRPNRAKQRLRQNQTVTTISGLQNSDIIDFLGPFGFDAAWIECEHGPVDWEALGDMTRACDLWGLTSITRVNANDPGLITRTLDRGSMGIVAPHVNSREAAEQAARLFEAGVDQVIFTLRTPYRAEKVPRLAKALEALT